VGAANCSSGTSTEQERWVGSQMKRTSNVVSEQRTIVFCEISNREPNPPQPTQAAGGEAP
jgi:hypothetical protein